MSGTLVDRSIARGLNPNEGQQTNPLAQFSQIVGLSNDLARNRRENELFGAQQAIGNAMQQSMDPATGTINMESFRKAIAGNPMAGFMAPQALAQAKMLEQGTLQVQQMQAALGMTRLNNLRQSVQGLLAKPNVTRQEVVTAVGNLLALPENERPFSAQVAASQLATLPDNPSAIRGWLMGHLASTDQGLQHLQQFLPRPTGVQTGAETRFVDTNPLTNPRAANQGVENQPSPEQRSGLVQRYNPATRQMEWVPRQDAGPMYGGSGNPA